MTQGKGRILAVFSIGMCASLALPAGPGWAARVRGSLRTHMYLRQDRVDNPVEEYFLPVRQYLNLNVTELSSPGWSFHGSGWARQDLGDRSDFTNIHGDDRFESELSYGYLEWRDPGRPNTYLRLGRQYVFGGGINERFDGLTYSKEFPKGHGFMVFGGIPSNSYYGGKSEDRVGGARVWMRPIQRSKLGFGYVQREDDGDVDREILTQDFFWRPFHWVELEENVSYDTISNQVVEFGAYAGFKFHPKSKFSLSYHQSIPGALLPKTSIFSVISNDEIQEWAIGLDFFPCKDWSLWTEAIYHDSRSNGGQNWRYQVDGNGYWDYRVGTRYYYSDDSSLSLELRHLDVPEQGVPFVEGASDLYESVDNGFDRIRFTDHHWINPWCWHSLELGATLFHDQVNGSDRSFDASSTWGYRPTEKVEAAATLRYIDSAVDNTEFQALLSVTYWFDKRAAGGGVEDLLSQKAPGSNRRRPHTANPIPAVFEAYE